MRGVPVWKQAGGGLWDMGHGCARQISWEAACPGRGALWAGGLAAVAGGTLIVRCGLCWRRRWPAVTPTPTPGPVTWPAPRAFTPSRPNKVDRPSVSARMHLTLSSVEPFPRPSPEPCSTPPRTLVLLRPPQLGRHPAGGSKEGLTAW